MPNVGAAIWRTILNIKLLCFPTCVPELLLSHLPMHSNVIIKNVRWPHFSWTAPLKPPRNDYMLMIFRVLLYHHASQGKFH